MATRTVTFAYTGGPQQWTVPADITPGTDITVTVRGAGGAVSGDGAGGAVSGTIAHGTYAVGDRWQVNVGGVGGVPSGSTAGAGGFNGGGVGGTGTSGGLGGYGGSGASDIRIDPNRQYPLTSRAAVAAGAGSSGTAGSVGTKGSGGAGGAATGHAGVSSSGGTVTCTGGTGGTATAGGTAGTGTASGNPGALGVGGAGRSVSGTNAAPGGAGGGGYYGGGSGGAAGGGSGSGGGGGGGSNYTGGLSTTTTNTQGGGAAALANGSISIAYSFTPAAPQLAPVNAFQDGGVYINALARFTWLSLNDDDGAGVSGQMRYRIVGNPTWTTVSSTAAAGGFYTYFMLPGTLAAGNYEWQANYTDDLGNVSPWSASSLFTAYAQGAAQFPYTGLGDQWPTSPAIGNGVVGAADMHARIDRPLEKISRRLAQYNQTDLDDPTRNADVGWSFASQAGGTSGAVNTPILFDVQLDSQGHAFPVYDQYTGIAYVPIGGIYLIVLSMRLAAAPASAVMAYVDGIPLDTLGDPGGRALWLATGSASSDNMAFTTRLLGGEKLSVKLGTASVGYQGATTGPDGSTADYLTYFAGWRIQA